MKQGRLERVTLRGDVRYFRSGRKVWRIVPWMDHREAGRLVSDQKFRFGLRTLTTGVSSVSYHDASECGWNEWSKSLLLH